jgi:16S rRNA (cytosine1402-N4)-methyltransferase
LPNTRPTGGLDGVVLDIGVSSMQIDEAERGFSFQKNGPLDMRMSASGVSAADVVNRAKVSDLIRIFGFLGEEKQSGRIARAIEKAREKERFTTTRQLANLIELTTPRKAKDKIHPATRVFQALRVFVNDELGELAEALFAAERALKPGGRLVVVSFHSLEDRIVKKFFQDRAGKAAGSRHLPASSRQSRNLRTSRAPYGGCQRRGECGQSARKIREAEGGRAHQRSCRDG